MTTEQHPGESRVETLAKTVAEQAVRLQAQEQTIRELERRLTRQEERLRAWERQAAVSGPEAAGRRPAIGIGQAFSGLKGFFGRSVAEWDILLGGTVLNRVGILVLLLGLTFFLKYAFDHAWLGPAGRVTTGLVFGLFLLAGGERFRNQGYSRFAYGLTGGGLGALYASIFAAYQFYRLIAFTPAFGLMLLVTATGIGLALRHGSPAIAALALAGGFVTPFVLTTPEPQPYGLFAYLTALNLVVVGIAVRRGWRAVNLLGFIFTAGSVIAWLESGFWPRFPEATLVFGTVCFGLYLAVAAFYSLRSGRPDRRVDILLIAANPAAYFGFLYVVLDHPQFLLWDAWAGFLAAGLALVYFILGYGIWRGVKAGLLPARLYLGVATALLTLAVPLQLSDQAVTICWTVLALVLWYAGLVIRDGRVRLAAGLIGLLTLVHLMVVDTPVVVWAADVYRPLLNGRTLAFLAVAGGLLAAVWAYRRFSPEPAAGAPSRERRLVARLPVLAGLLGLLLFTLEANTYCDFQIAQVSKEMAEATRSYQQSPAMFKADIPPEAYAPWRQQIDYWRNAGRLAVSGIWTLAACLLIASGLWFRRHRWRLAGMGLLGVVLLKVFFLDLAQLDLVFRIVTFMGLGAVMLAASYFYDRFAGSAGKRKGPQEDG